MGKLFGTDGIRGLANSALTAELALDVGRAITLAAQVGLLDSPAQLRPRVVVGRDTRVSGPMLEAAITAGLCSMGADVVSAGILPTAGVAYLVASMKAGAGVVLSASHNPAADNGIKVFGAGGWKLSETAEQAIEDLVGKPHTLPVGERVGASRPIPDAADRYVAHLKPTVSADFRGLKVVIDCANGAASEIAPAVFESLGLEVTALFCGDGAINENCGATQPGVIAAHARRLGCIGLSFDGDADRLIAADENGEVLSGEAILSVLSDGSPIVTTVMANQAFRGWASKRGIELIETAVGDRYVLAAMRENNVHLGGEQSGHVIRLEHATTGDGILTALGLLEAVTRNGSRLADAVEFRPLPQVLVNISGNRERLDSAAGVWDAVDRASTSLGSDGRVLVRPSGTEDLVRVMVEAPALQQAQMIADEIASVIRTELR